MFVELGVRKCHEVIIVLKLWKFKLNRNLQHDQSNCQPSVKNVFLFVFTFSEFSSAAAFDWNTDFEKKYKVKRSQNNIQVFIQMIHGGSELTFGLRGLHLHGGLYNIPVD